MNNSVKSKDNLLKLHIQRALCYGVKWRKNSGIFLTTRSSILPFPSKVWLSNIIPKRLLTLQFWKCLISQIKACIQDFQMRYQSFLGHWYPNSYSWFSDSIDILFVLITTVQGQIDFLKHHECFTLNTLTFTRSTYLFWQSNIFLFFPIRRTFLLTYFAPTPNSLSNPSSKFERLTSY